eukprot:gene11333-11483_t
MVRQASGNSADRERLHRVLDAKQRLIGVDVAALNAQVEEKKHLKAAEQAAERQYAEEVAGQAGMLTAHHLGAVELKRSWTQSVQDFRNTFQGKASSREWDLNRPDAKQLELPTRVGDDDPRWFLTVYAVAYFYADHADDNSNAMTKKTALKAQQAAQDKHEKQQLAQAVRGLDSLQLSVSCQEAAARAELAGRVAAVNQELRALQAANRDAQRQAELQAKLAELAAAEADPWLNEDPGQAASASSPVRVRKDHWKGMSEQQRRAILEQQLAQVEERKAAAVVAAAEEAATSAALRNIHKAVMQQALSAEDFRRKQAAATAEQLKQQMAGKAARDAQLRDLYANKIDESYFKQSGTSHR